MNECRGCEAFPKCTAETYSDTTCRYLRFSYGMDDNTKMTNADRIRAMSDEELAKTMYACNSMEEKIPFCQNLPECDSLLETEEGIPEDKCIGCLLKWLQQPAQEEDDG